MSVSTQNQPLFEILIENGASIKKRDPFGWSCLHLAAEMGSINIVTILLTKGSDPNYINEGKSPLDLAFENNQFKVVSLLRPVTTKAINTVTKKEITKQEPLEPIEVNKEKAEKCKVEGNLLFKKSKNLFEE